MPDLVQKEEVDVIYLEVFRYELIACTVFLLFALDVRFGLFTRTHLKALNGTEAAPKTGKEPYP